MTRKIMQLDEIEKHFKKEKAAVLGKKGSTMYLAGDLGASMDFIEDENILWALKEIKAAGGSICMERKKRATKQEFKNAVADKIRAFGAAAPQGTPTHQLAAFVM